MSTSDGRRPYLSKLLPFPWNAFPPYVEWVIAYGSAVFPQASAAAIPVGRTPLGKTETPVHGKVVYKGKELKCRLGRLRNFLALGKNGVPCRDYLLLVPGKDLVAFHTENLRQHPTHYAWPFRIAGPRSACEFQRAGRGVEVFYNTLLCLDHGQYGKQLSKYGVATVEDFQAELVDWSSLFFSGRLHKPVQFYSPNHTPTEDAPFWPHLEANRLNAIRAALFLHPGPAIPVKTLLTTICGLSYTGDIRVGVAENPGKLENIVAGQTVELLALYYRLLTKYFPQVRIRGSNIPSAGIKRLCDQLTASCFDATKLKHIPAEDTRSGARLTSAGFSYSEATRVKNDMDMYGVLREEIINGKLILKLPEVEVEKNFRFELLDALPPFVRDDVWKRARRRGKPKVFTGRFTKCGGGLLSEHKASQPNSVILQKLPTRCHISGSETGASALPNDSYPTPADLLASLTSTVRRSSAITAVKSAVTAGPSKLFIYGLRKLAKRWLPT